MVEAVVVPAAREENIHPNEAGIEEGSELVTAEVVSDVVIEVAKLEELSEEAIEVVITVDEEEILEVDVMVTMGVPEPMKHEQALAYCPSSVHAEAYIGSKS